ncbi:MAG: hypothetical protein MI974_17130 [Chitinophagales bacterium]|nr:hypothetical protein [Chitinophagales bacterium]
MENSIFQNPTGGIEIAISPSDLKIEASCQIFEKQSTAGSEEVPQIIPPQSHSLTNRMIQSDQNWCVHFNWKVYGPLACLLDCGYWKTKVYFELMGGGETHFSPEETIQDVGQSGHLYQSAVQIAPYSLKPGVYRVVCCLQYCFANGKPGPIAGFNDKGLIKIYEDQCAYKEAPNSNGQSVKATI